MFKRAAVLAVSCGAVFVGCGTEAQTEFPSENEEIISNLVEAGFRSDDIQVSAEGAVYVGGDAHVTLQASREMLQPTEGSQEQYRTTNLVAKTVRRICVNPTSTFNSYARLVQGLDMALANYNALGLCFTMVRGSTSGCDATITAQTMAGSGGSAGFPSGGRPYGTIYIGTGLNTASVDMVEHVITHELGHALGFRHSDFFHHATCGGNEGSAGVGAIHIPGTPTTSFPGSSLMNSCTRSVETGEFTSSDITALRYLYSC